MTTRAKSAERGRSDTPTMTILARALIGAALGATVWVVLVLLLRVPLALVWMFSPLFIPLYGVPILVVAGSIGYLVTMRVLESGTNGLVLLPGRGWREWAVGAVCFTQVILFLSAGFVISMYAIRFFL